MVIDQFFRELDLVPNVVMEADDTEAIKRLVESRLWLFDFARTCRAGSCFFHTLPRQGASLDPQPGTCHGPGRLSAKVDGIDC